MEANKLGRIKRVNILQVGYGWPPKQGGGALLYTKSLSSELAKRGHNVTSFFSGRQNFLPFSYLKQSTEENVNLIELVNSPNFYRTQFNYCQSELQNAIIERKFSQVLDKVKPDVVHIQNFPGLTASIVSVAKDKGYPVVVSLHNYIPLCPVGEIFDYTKCEICNYRNCGNCYYEPNSFQRFSHRLLMFSVYALSENVKKALRKKISTNSTIQIPSDPLGDTREKENRLEFFKKELSRADLLLAVSGRVKEIFQRYFKMNFDNIEVNHIGTKAAEFINFGKISRVSYPIKFIFLGSLEPHKGFQNVLKAFKNLDQKKSKLLVYAPVNETYRDKVTELQGSYNIEFRGPYQYESLNEILKQADVGLVTPICHDNAPQVVFEMFSAGLPIIASNVGGMADFVIDGKNGYIYAYDDCSDLEEKMRDLTDNPKKIVEFNHKIPPMKTISDHISNLEEIYSNLTGAKS